MGKLCVGDLIGSPAVYAVPIRGICRLPTAGIKRERTNAEGTFSVDVAQFFLIDAEHYDAVTADLSVRETYAPDWELFQKVRDRHKTAFGYVIAGNLFDTEFNGDGTYRIDVDQIASGLPAPPTGESPDVNELLRRIASKMHTIVCARCFNAELLKEHPEASFLMSDSDMAEEAVGQGWTAIREHSDFGDITPICPDCRKKAGR